MNIRTLIDELENIAQLAGDDAEVRIAEQPTWPFENAISSIVCPEPRDNDSPYIVYLEEGRQIGYLPRNVKDELGW